MAVDDALIGLGELVRVAVGTVETQRDSIPWGWPDPGFDILGEDPEIVTNQV
jgi:hypothetical protein